MSARRELASVALRLPSWIGDAVMAEPLVRAACGDPRVGRARLIGREHVLELFEERFQGVERVVVARGEKDRAELYTGATHALLLNGSWSSAFAAARARVPARAGFATRGRRALLTHPLTPPLERGGIAVGLAQRGARPRTLPRPFSAACRELGALFGLVVVDARPRLVPSSRGLALASARGLLDQRFLLLHAGSRPESAKGVPPELWAAVLGALEHESERRIVLACAPGEEDVARRAFAACTDPRTRLLDAPPAGIAEIVAWTSRAELVITADNGARHIAQALARPTVVLFGPTDPRHTAEHGANVRGVRVDLECSPCHRERCPLPRPGERACMRRIDPATVVELARAACGLPTS